MLKWKTVCLLFVDIGASLFLWTDDQIMFDIKELHGYGDGSKLESSIDQQQQINTPFQPNAKWFLPVTRGSYKQSTRNLGKYITKLIQHRQHTEV